MSLRYKLTLMTAGMIFIVLSASIAFRILEPVAMLEEQPNMLSAGRIGHMVFFFLFIPAVMLIATYIYAGKLTCSILELSRASEEIANGNFDVSVSEKHGDDEIGTLGRSMRHMAGELSSLMGHINSSVEDIEKVGKILAATASQSVKVTEEMTMSVNGISEDANAQLLAVNGITEAVRGTSLGLENVTSITGAISEKSIETSSLADQGSKSLESAIRQVSDISTITRQIAEAIRTLGEKSRNINEILALIKAISEQTNLLALNAAIEAARAGEAGRGFAVVAEEVRKLAEQSRQATGQISSEIDEIRQNTEDAVKLMGVGVAESEEGVEAVTQNGEMFKHILADIVDLNSEIQRITSVVEELSESNSVIRSSIDELSEISVKTSKAALYLEAAAHSQSSDISEIAFSSKEVLAMAENMRATAHHLSMSGTHNTLSSSVSKQEEIIKKLQAESLK